MVMNSKNALTFIPKILSKESEIHLSVNKDQTLFREPYAPISGIFWWMNVRGEDMNNQELRRMVRSSMHERDK